MIHKQHLELHRTERRIQVIENNRDVVLGHMTKMVAMPIHDKTLSSPDTKGLRPSYSVLSNEAFN